MKRIYILEDDENIGHILKVFLEDEGYTVFIFNSLSTLKLQLKDSLPCLFILDIMLPDSNGIEICKDLKTDLFTKHIPIIIMSAGANEKQSKSVFADAFIAKPFDLEAIASQIKTLL